MNTKNEDKFDLNFLQSLENVESHKPIVRNSDSINVLNKSYDPRSCPFAPAISNNSRILMMKNPMKPL